MLGPESLGYSSWKGRSTSRTLDALGIISKLKRNVPLSQMDWHAVTHGRKSSNPTKSKGSAMALAFPYCAVARAGSRASFRMPRNSRVWVKRSKTSSTSRLIRTQSSCPRPTGSESCRKCLVETRVDKLMMPTSTRNAKTAQEK